jgi:hypothetical protein
MNRFRERTGVGYVEFAENYASQEVMKCSGKILNGKTITVKIISHMEMMNKIELKGFGIEIHGLPKTITYRDVCRFLGGNQDAHDVYITWNDDGQATGDVRVVLDIFQDYHNALMRSRDFMGPHRVRIDPMSNVDMQLIIRTRTGMNQC